MSSLTLRKIRPTLTVEASKRMEAQFESFRGWAGEEFIGYSPVLVHVETQRAVAGVRLTERVIETGEDSYYWTFLTLSNGFEGAPLIRYILFSKDQQFAEVEWMVQVYESTGFILKHFAPRAPLLVGQNKDARFQLCDVDGHAIAESIEVWRDSDLKRQVLKQFALVDGKHPMAYPALWSLLATSVASWY